jgi:ribosomal protein S18 acetylase RimI-like enzyme
MGVVIRKMRVDDIVDVKRVDLVSWGELFERTYGEKVKLSPRTDENILSYLHSDPDGAFVASDEYAGVIGLVFSHVWGATGWTGPLSVLPSYQLRGLGKDLLRHSLNYLEDIGCLDIGLETRPENAQNLGMYLKVGLRPESFVLVLGRRLEPEWLEEEPAGEVSVERYSESSIQGKLKSEFRRISGALRLGLDYTKEVDLATEFSLGDTIVATSGGRVAGFCVVHTRSRRANMSTAAIRMVAVDPAAREEVIEPLLVSAELMAADTGCIEISVPVPAPSRRALDISFSRGYSVIDSFERLMWIGSSGVNERTYNLCTWSG